MKSYTKCEYVDGSRIQHIIFYFPNVSESKLEKENSYQNFETSCGIKVGLRARIRQSLLARDFDNQVRTGGFDTDEEYVDHLHKRWVSTFDSAIKPLSITDLFQSVELAKDKHSVYTVKTHLTNLVARRLKEW